MRGKSKHPELCTGAANVESNLKAVLSFPAPPHPEHGHKPLQMLHKTCRIVQAQLAKAETSEQLRARRDVDAGKRAEDERAKAALQAEARAEMDAAYRDEVAQRKAEMSARVKAQKEEQRQQREEQRAKERASRGLASMAFGQEEEEEAPAPAPAAEEAKASAPAVATQARGARSTACPRPAT